MTMSSPPAAPEAKVRRVRPSGSCRSRMSASAKALLTHSFCRSQWSARSCDGDPPPEGDVNPTVLAGPGRLGLPDLGARDAAPDVGLLLPLPLVGERVVHHDGPSLEVKSLDVKIL